MIKTIFSTLSSLFVLYVLFRKPRMIPTSMLIELTEGDLDHIRKHDGVIGFNDIELKGEIKIVLDPNSA